MKQNLKVADWNSVCCLTSSFREEWIETSEESPVAYWITFLLLTLEGVD
ncbi:hypothetical protein [Leptospira noguchii]